MVIPSLVRGTAPGTPAAGGAAATSADTKKVQDLLKELSAVDDKITALMPTATLLADASFRAGDGQKALPLIKDSIRVLGELETAAKADPKLKNASEMAEEVHAARYHAMAFAAALGDKDIAAALENQAKWDQSADGLKANCAYTLSQWVRNSSDAAAQKKVLEDFVPAVKDNAENEEVVSTLATMRNLGAANEAMEDQVATTIRDNMKGPVVQSLLAQIDGEKAQKAMVGKPLVIEGRTSTGGKFSSADYKGKVVMVDFWATWCGPCIAELPNVKKVYAAYHDKGFEIVGLSCDSGDDELNAFTKEKEMPWVQLRETSQTQAKNWHPLAEKYHVDGIPQMFLIDRDGILRYVDARNNLEKKVSALVEEKKPAAQPAAK
jgi:thiol-disulfide isomerase/thioredoxin